MGDDTQNLVEVVALLRKRADISRAAFIDYYETRHAPLIRSIAPEIIRYERAFLREEGAVVAPGMDYPDFDVVTRIGFADEASYQRAMARFAEPQVAERIAEDEEHLFDRSHMRFFRIDGRSSF